MNLLIDFNKKTSTYIAIAILGVFLLIIITIYIILLRKNNTKKIVKDLEVKVADLNNYATKGFDALLNRLNAIASLNPEYKELYDKHKITRDSIVEKYKNNLNSKVDLIHKLNEQHKTKELKEKAQEANETYKAYKNNIQQLEDNIQIYLTKNENCHEHSVPYKRKYREIKENYNNHVEELALVSKSFNEVFEKIERVFQEFDDLCNSAQYEQAEEKLVSLDKVLVVLEEAVLKMPSLCARIEYVIPKKIAEIREQYQQLDESNYPLHHLRVNFTLEEIEKVLDDLKHKLTQFSYKNASQNLDAIDEKLMYINQAFKEEKEARSFFDGNIDQAYNDSTNVEKRFTRIKRSLPSYKEVYWLQDKYIDSVTSLQEEVTKLARFRREIETYSHSSSRQPYSILVLKLNDLIKQNKFIEDTILQFQNYLVSLKTDSEFAFKTLHDSFLSLKELEYKVSTMNIKQYSENLNPQFYKAYKLLDSIGMVIKVKPINVEALNESVSKVIDIEQGLKDDINAQYKKMTEAEDAIVMANRYRGEFHDAKQALAKAEEHFFNFDFITTLQEAVNTMKNMDPNIGKK